MLRTRAILGCAALGLLLLTAFGVRQYQWNVSALLHMDVPFGEEHQVPEGVVLYTDAAYDGMLYYQIARDLPEFFQGQETSYNSAYRYQRILLPLFTFVLSFGYEPAFSIVMLLINMAAALGTLFLLLKLTRGKTLHAFAAFANPAVFVGILYMLTEPLSLFFVALFFWFWERKGRAVDAWGVVALTLSLLARETTVFLIAPLILWNVWQRQWKQVVLLALPVALLTAWQYVLTLRLGSVAMAGSEILDIPFAGPFVVLRRMLVDGPDFITLSSVALLLFVLPLFFFVSREAVRRMQYIDVLTFLMLALVVTIVCMDAYIMWGAITSIGRVVTPLYVVYALYASERDTPFLRGLSWTLIGVSTVAAIGIAAVKHPFIIS